MMSQFSNEPRESSLDKRLTKAELVEAVRSNIAAEHEAIQRYLAQTDTIDHPLVRAVLVDITGEKQAHVGELERLLEILTGEEYNPLRAGREKIDAMAVNLTTVDEETETADLEDTWKEASKGLDELGI
jgi:rubrerythrin